MKIKSKYKVPTNTKGALFIKGSFSELLDPGIYTYYFTEPDEYLIVILDSKTREVVLRNQEILSADYIAFRLGFVVEYKITNFESACTQLDFSFIPKGIFNAMNQFDERVIRETQVVIKKKLASLESMKVLSTYTMLDANETELADLNTNLTGMYVTRVRVNEVSFPKQIQEIFATKLLSIVRAETDLENARTVVASTRALKNASSMLKDDPGLRFIMYLETMNKISSSGKHTFVVGGGLEDTLTK